MKRRRRIKMSLHTQPLEPIPDLTSRIAHASFPKGTLAMHLRDALGPIYEDADFAHLFPRRGRAAEAPWRLALVTILQALENLSDRQAAEMVRGRLDWKYALSLPLDDQGFDASILTDFRQRLLDHAAQDLLLEPILRVCREHGWLSAGGKQRSDSTWVIANVRGLSSLESVGESLRRFSTRSQKWNLTGYLRSLALTGLIGMCIALSCNAFPKKSPPKTSCAGRWEKIAGICCKQQWGSKLPKACEPVPVSHACSRYGPSISSMLTG